MKNDVTVKTIMDTMVLFFRFAVALFIGFLIGLEREFASDDPETEIAAGIRTFSLMGILGCLSAYVADVVNSVLPLVTILASVGSFFVVNYFVESKKGKTGLTTDISALLVVLIGILVYYGHIKTSAALGVIITILLSSKIEMHNFAHLVTKQDIYSTLKFAVITLIILPILPNKEYGLPPFDVLNPFKIWLLVILISAISFVGYIFIKLLGSKKGMGITGILGGLASSTALTLSLAQKSKDNAHLSSSFCLAIILAWIIMFTRVLIEVAVINNKLIQFIYLPFMICITFGVIYSVYLYYKKAGTSRENQDINLENPFELKPAIKFAALFSIILVASKAAQIYFGKTGIYISSFLGGLADVDAIALSVAQLARTKEIISNNIAAKAIVIAAVSNTFAKGILVMSIGSKGLKKIILPGYIMLLIIGISTFFLV